MRFTDISRDSVVGRAAGCIAAWDVTQGKGDGSYDPRGRVSRGQMASFLDRALAAVGRRPPAPSTTRFRDARGTTHAAAIERLAGAGLVAGRADGTYGPQDPVTRAQMATFLRRAYEHAARRTLPEPAVPFSDVAGSPHTPAIAAVAGTGIAAGTGPGTYDPNANVTRAQMAQFLARWLDLAVTDGLATGPR
ncbi:S-layer homology domain-containing protein [Nitriliruptoraceae bacterium ZYF776]|nr:S-layer homology domain-containing protein [Profundirhabdus halotolerans]